MLVEYSELVELNIQIRTIRKCSDTAGGKFKLQQYICSVIIMVQNWLLFLTQEQRTEKTSRVIASVTFLLPATLLSSYYYKIIKYC